MKNIKKIIEEAFERRANITPENVDEHVKYSVNEAIELLDNGKQRVAERIITHPERFPGIPEEKSDWKVNEWLKKAVLLSFRINYNDFINGGFTNYFDKVSSKYANYDIKDFDKDGIRVVPPAVVRKGSYVAPDVVLMPSYINIGAYVGEGTMVDTWATVGSCAQIGKKCHLSGGVGIGGVLEPLQASPTIIEDNCFIGARSEIVEGVIVEEGSVISMGVYIGKSTKIYDREKDEIIYGRVPAGSVVVSGTLPEKNGKCSLYCAVIVKQVDEQTRSKTSTNELLRDIK